MDDEIEFFKDFLLQRDIWNHRRDLAEEIKEYIKDELLCLWREEADGILEKIMIETNFDVLDDDEAINAIMERIDISIKAK